MMNDVESLQLALEEVLFISFNSILQPGRSALSQSDVDDGIRFVTLESQFENKETVLNW